MTATDDNPAPLATGQARARIGRCPRCGTRTRLDPTNSWRPFCSERCKLIDLEGWFGDRYRIAGEPASTPAFLDDPGYDVSYDAGYDSGADQ